MKAVILAGGSGTRLYPTTRFVNKHLLPVYNKPMIYYPLSLALLIKIREIVFVINPQDVYVFSQLFDYLRFLNLDVSYVVQEEPRGLAEGILLVQDHVKDRPFLYLLGDNILYGHDVARILLAVKEEISHRGGAYVFGYPVKDPERFGVVEFDQEGRVISIEEKPQNPKSNYAVIGVYFFDSRAVEFAREVRPSPRGEYEITSVLEEYLKRGELRVRLLGRGFAWFDAGTHDSFLDAGKFVATVENKTGLLIACIEEIVYNNGWIDRAKLLECASLFSKTEYGRYLMRLAG